MFLARYIKSFFFIITLTSIVSCSIPTKQNSTPNKVLAEVATVAIEQKEDTQVAFNQPQVITTKEELLINSETTIWEGIKAGFMLPTIEHSSIDREYTKLIKHPHILKQNIESALPYLSYVLSNTQKRQIPSELALIPFIESNYQLTAKSSSNAKGLWQIVPSTAKSLGLKKSTWREDSYNPILSTDAALEYFIKNNKRFDNWILSIAAYNAGPTRVSKELAVAKQSANPHVFFSLALPPETRNYLPKLLAYKKLFAEYQTRPDIFAPKPEFIPFSTVTIAQQTSFSVLASIAKVDQQHITNYNPGYTSWSTPPNTKAVLLLPANSASLLKNKVRHLSSNQRVPWIEYKIKSGDTLSKIARTHQISIGTLKKLNALGSDRIVAGRILRIPAIQTGV